MSIVGNADGNVCLAAAIYDVKTIALDKSLLTRRRKAKHYFT
jgi:hypothetical protein